MSLLQGLAYRLADGFPFLSQSHEGEQKHFKFLGSIPYLNDIYGIISA